MKQTLYILLTSIVLLCLSCNHEKPAPAWGELPTVTALGSLKASDFVPTLENPLRSDRNVIYAPSLLFAWNEIRNELGTGIVLGPETSEDLLLLNGSRSFEHTLEGGEYNITTEIEDDAISVSAFFNKTLPFPAKMETIDQGISFKGKTVAAFGMPYPNSDITAFSEILYYRSDDEFALKLSSEDKANEIILVKGFNSLKDLSEALTITRELSESGHRERQDRSLSWKYDFNPEDLFSIPVIKFNIDTRYSNLEGQKFSTTNKVYVIRKAWQRTGFILNEHGAVVESEATVMTDSAPLPEPELKPHPKHMIFDKPFFIIVKKKTQENPYFVMKVEDPELMQTR